jgi:hypothetical protein
VGTVWTEKAVLYWSKSVKTFGVFSFGVLLAVTAAAQQGEDKRPKIDVDNYAIDAQINPDTQTLTARAAVRFASRRPNHEPHLRTQ